MAVLFGSCKCVINPNGRGGLRGFNVGEQYDFKKVTANGVEFYQVKTIGARRASYYADVGAFKTFFKLVTEPKERQIK